MVEHVVAEKVILQHPLQTVYLYRAIADLTGVVSL